jgi:hypothetical protein
MGMMLSDSTALDLLAQLNKRFGAGPAIDEMIALQREFEIFSPRHSLRNSYDLIGIRPSDRSERRRWYLALEHLKTYPSDRPNINGYDRLIAAYVENFQEPKPLPIFTQCHAAADDPRVLVSTGNPIIFIPDQHLVISIPTTAAAAVAASRGRPATP